MYLYSKYRKRMKEKMKIDHLNKGGKDFTRKKNLKESSKVVPSSEFKD